MIMNNCRSYCEQQTPPIQYFRCVQCVSTYFLCFVFKSWCTVAFLPPFLVPPSFLLSLPFYLPLLSSLSCAQTSVSLLPLPLPSFPRAEKERERDSVREGERNRGIRERYKKRGQGKEMEGLHPSLPSSLLPPKDPLPETIEPIETDGAKLFDLVIEAEQLLQTYDTELDLLVQHFYYLLQLRANRHICV